jgi:hypothetical protein
VYYTGAKLLTIDQVCCLLLVEPSFVWQRCFGQDKRFPRPIMEIAKNHLPDELPAAIDGKHVTYKWSCEDIGSYLRCHRHYWDE